jgi:hypothetical protein
MSAPAQRQAGLPPGLADPWGEAWRLGAAMTWAGFQTATRLCDVRPWRTFWVTQLTQAADRYARSPEFLEFLAHNLRAMAGLARLNSQLLSLK